MGQPEEILRKVLENIAKDKDIDNYKVDIDPITSGGANYSSAIFKAIISAPKQDEIKLFAKVAIVAESIRKMMKGDRMFEMEGYFYTDLAKKYNYLQDKYEIPKEERLIIPKFYGSNPNSMEETIVLEDLTAQGYGMYDRFTAVDWDYAAKAVEELAKLHALSFGFKHEFPEEYEAKHDDLGFLMSFNLDEMKGTWEKMAHAAYSSVDDDDLRRRLEKFIKDLCTKECFEKYYGPGKRSQIVHGDYRPSNLLHRIKNGNVSVIPIDYQTLRVGCPASDLLYFIYTATDKRFRTQHLQNLLDHYYSTLAKFLNYFQLDPDNVYSRKDFDEDFKDMLPYGLSTSVFLLPVVMVELAEAPDMSTEGATFETFAVKSNDAFKERFNGCLQDFIEWGVL